MPHIYLFYPFDDGTADSTLDGLVPGIGQDPSHYQSPKYGQIYRVDMASKVTIGPGGLWNANDQDEIYVVGHSASGLKIIGDANKQHYDQSWLLERLAACGLQPTNNPKIVLYCCESGKGMGCLAEKLANAMKTGLVLDGSRRPFASFNKVWGFTRKVSVKAMAPWKGAPKELCVLDSEDKQTGKKNWAGLNALMQDVCVRCAPTI